MHLSSEYDLIQRIQKWMGKPSRRVFQGIGDDTAVVRPPKDKLLATVDMMVEGTHFDLSYTIPQELGHKAMAVNLSDIASMGGKPLYALVSLGLSSKTSLAFIKDLYKGMRTLAQKFDVNVIGGNIARSPGRLVIDVILIGEVKNKALLRTGARNGDLVAVSGYLGKAAAGLSCLKQYGRNAFTKYPNICRAHLVPKPRLNESRALAATKAMTSMIDISDGLSTELHHLAEGSNVGFLIEESSLPVGKSTIELATDIQGQPLKWVLDGGEDYELLFTFRPKDLKKVENAMKKVNKKLYVIGEVRKKSDGIVLLRRAGGVKEIKSSGWDHFQ